MKKKRKKINHEKPIYDYLGRRVAKMKEKSRKNVVIDGIKYKERYDPELDFTFYE